MADFLECFGGVLLLAGVVLDIVSVASNNWMTFFDGLRSGLWAVCTADAACEPVKTTGSLDGIRAMMVTSVIVSGTALVVLVISVTYDCAKTVTSIFVSIFVAASSFFAVLLTLIGVLVYKRKIWNQLAEQFTNVHYGYCFWLAVASIILFFLAGAFFLASAIVSYFPENTVHDRPSNKWEDKVFNFVHPSIHFLDDPHGSKIYPNQNMHYSTALLPPGVYSPVSINVTDSKPQTIPYTIPRPSVSA